MEKIVVVLIFEWFTYRYEMFNICFVYNMGEAE